SNHYEDIDDALVFAYNEAHAIQVVLEIRCVQFRPRPTCIFSIPGQMGNAFLRLPPMERSPVKG
ncbi:MAG: hypothetical protein EBS13_08565, partial [Verrucomicrobia bacterium]|nr:hypothetical protein [Verrucomicrobiota bacterium]